MRRVGARKREVVMNSFSYHFVPAKLLVDEALGLIGVAVVPMGGRNTDLEVEVTHHLEATVFVGVAAGVAPNSGLGLLYPLGSKGIIAAALRFIAGSSHVYLGCPAMN